MQPNPPSDVVVGSETIYWPADSLPSILPRAKIWTYGYNAGVNNKLFQPNNQNSILEHGNDFMVKMERALRDKLPIIFVAHSLGGLVVKAAINGMQSSIDSRYQQFSRRISAVVFCGTPHRGSDAAALGKLASNLLALALVDSNSRLLSDMRVDSRTLESIQTDFLRALYRTPLRIHSFQEGRALTGVRGLNDKVVGDESSRLGLAEETFETIDADHREMVRKPGVKDISDILKDLEREAVKATKSKSKWRIHLRKKD
ncbi:Alpha/Beta hydrolase protein [Xylaria scruposa]|nr:Alpha/Beta hydrolase protein [Xylaria scruposa]